LAKRLARRGLVLSGAALAAVLSGGAAPACVPAPVMYSTIQAVTSVAAGRAVGLVSAHAAALTEGVLRAMVLNKLKSVAVVVLLALTCVGAGVLAHTALAAKPNEAVEAKADDKPADAPKPPAKEKAKPAAVPAGEVARTYLTNAALADERFTGKPVVVSGKLIRIQRGGILVVDEKKKVVYDLVMSAGVLVDDTNPLLLFAFTEDDRAELAKLEPGQILSVEGKTQGPDGGGTTISFYECKLVAKGGQQ
jgi:hypothetical protein